jgi:phosphoenolpyruvate synthase/pyruvate phosphate dikinase
MLGLRGCRLGIAFPEITEMQARAIFEAAVSIKLKGGDPHLEIMVPLITSIEEMRNQAAIVRHVAELVFKEKGATVEYMVGTMIELPRAALTADQIAEEAEFFSFGTNDLTQTTFGISRDDINKFLRISRTTSSRKTPLRPSTREVLASLSKWPPSRDARLAQPSRSASAANMAETRNRSNSATASASTTSPALRSAS